jgi:hypothetical protein
MKFTLGAISRIYIYNEWKLLAFLTIWKLNLRFVDSLRFSWVGEMRCGFFVVDAEYIHLQKFEDTFEVTWDESL